MTSIVQIYAKKSTRTRLKALAHLDNRTLSAYIDELARKQVELIPPRKYSAAVQHVTDGNPDNG